MFDINRRAKFNTVGDLKKLLENVSDDTPISMYNDSVCWFHIEKDGSEVCLNTEALEHEYKRKADFMLIQKLDKEMQDFKKTYETMESIKVYNDWYIICFYESYYEMLYHINQDNSGYSDCESILRWLDTFEKPLKFLYDEWMSGDGEFSMFWDDMINWLYDLKCDIEYWDNTNAQ